MEQKDHTYKEMIYRACLFLLVLLWTYTAFSKWAAPHAFRLSIAGQPLGELPVELVFWTLPAAELLAAIGLCLERTRTAGLLLSLVMISVFTLYVGLVIWGHFGKMPCACGGVIAAMGWKNHLWFNLFFLALTVYGTIHHFKRKQRVRPCSGA